MRNYPDEGYIKFTIHWKKKPAFSFSELQDLIACRDIMFHEGLIGFDPADKVGFGNISARIPGTDSFFISATQTGHIPKTNPEQYVKVVSADPAENELYCEGPAKASSESMTHAAVYSALPDCNAVIHVHHAATWVSEKLPFSGAEIPYGTPEMATTVKNLVILMNQKNQQVLVMKGHKDGVIAFGKTLQLTAEALLEEIYSNSEKKS